MSNEKLTLTNREQWCTAEIKKRLGNLYSDSRNFLGLLLYMPFPLEKFRPQSFFDDASAIYDQAIEFGEPIPFHVLAVYIAAFIDILEKRIKE